MDARGAGRVQAQLLQQAVAGLGQFFLAGQAPQARAALHHGFVKQPLGRGQAQQCGDFGSAARLAKDGDIAWVATKAFDVVADPAQRLHLVKHAQVGRFGGKARCLDQQRAKDVEAVVDGDDHHILRLRQVAAVKAGRAARAHGKRTAVQPHQHGAFFAIQRRGVNSQRQAVFADGDVRPVPGKLGHRHALGLRGIGTVCGGIAHPGPRFFGHRGAKTVGSSGAFAIGNTFEGKALFCAQTAQAPGGRFHHRIGAMGTLGAGTGQQATGNTHHGADLEARFQKFSLIHWIHTLSQGTPGHTPGKERTVGENVHTTNESMCMGSDAQGQRRGRTRPDWPSRFKMTGRDFSHRESAKFLIRKMAFTLVAKVVIAHFFKNQLPPLIPGTQRRWRPIAGICIQRTCF